jgi:hypothetical protein
MKTIAQTSLATLDAGKVRLGAIARSLPIKDSGKVRLGAIARTI